MRDDDVDDDVVKKHVRIARVAPHGWMGTSQKRTLNNGDTPTKIRHTIFLFEMSDKCRT